MPTNKWLHGYFAKLNPLAEKIAYDMGEVISAYDHVWLTLSPSEQDDILNDTIIKPELTIRYYENTLSATSSTQSRKEEESRLAIPGKRRTSKGQKSNLIYGFDRINLYTYLQQNVGLKILHDENIGDYRDEHSFPFSFKTKSQMNLSEIGVKSIVPVASNPVSPKTIPPVKVKAAIKPGPEPHTQIKSPSLKEESKARNIAPSESINLIAVEKLNRLSNFGSKNTLLSVSSDSNDSENDTKEHHSENSKLLPEKVQIPKGFDFLSNW